MTIIGGKFTREKRNLVTYIENRQYELLKELAGRQGRSISAEAALAIKKYLAEYGQEETKGSPERTIKRS